MHVDTFALIRVPTLFCPRNSRSFFHFFKVSLNIPNELRDSLNHSLNINWTGIAYYILSTLHVHVCLVEPLWLIAVYPFIPTLIWLAFMPYILILLLPTERHYHYYMYIPPQLCWQGDNKSLNKLK